MIQQIDQLTKSVRLNEFIKEIPTYNPDKTIIENIVSNNNLTFSIYLICIAILFGLITYFNEEQSGGMQLPEILSIINLKVIYQIIDTFKKSTDPSPKNLMLIIEQTIELNKKKLNLTPKKEQLDLFNKNIILTGSLKNVSNALLTDYNVIINKTKPYGVKLDYYSDIKIKKLINELFLAYKDLDKLLNNNIN